ncbi:PREDICTED: protein LHY-like isoform X2 [Lupinus angustifolius]|uniref:protein LHY-like isoform X2 n=1 Tax=Lupinus angustifolius TaxID=3871 RepID=UPI00092E58CF|nr:PREDICTED: protein LHY-like isoform X2 [Lupinus angustifolius]
MDAYSSGEEVVVKTRKPYTITKQRERWTDEEHNRFLEALKLYGRAWQRIEEHIGTKTAVQIRSHAQKFFSKLEKEALLKGISIGHALDIEIPPPRPKRKPSNPYPRKTNVGSPTINSRSDQGTVASSHSKEALDLEKEPLPENDEDERPTTVKENKDDNCSKVFAVIQQAPCSSVSSAISASVLLRNSCALREFIPSVKEVVTRDETEESLVTVELGKRKLEINGGKHTQQASKFESSDATQAKSVQTDTTDGLNCALTSNGMQGNQNYPRHITVQVVEGNHESSTQNPSQDKLFRDSMFQPMIGGVNGQPKLFTNSAPSNISENQSNTGESSIHQPFPPCPPSAQHNHDDYQTILQMSSTFSSVIVSTLLQNPAAHAAASFAATFWPYANSETSVDSPMCSQGGIPSRQVGSPPSIAAIAAATVGAATAWWAAHGMLPLCAPLHTTFPCPPSSRTAIPSMNAGEAPSVTEQGEINLQNPPLEDKMFNPEYSETQQAQQHSLSSSPFETEESGDAKLNTSSKAINNEMNHAISEHLDTNKTNGNKPVDRSSCGSNTTSSSEEADALEKDEKEKEEPGPETHNVNHLDPETSNRLSCSSRSIGYHTDYWKDVSDEGRLAFQALFSRQVLPQSFSPPKNTNYKDKADLESKKCSSNCEPLESKKCSPNCEPVQKTQPFVENNNNDNNDEEGLLTIGLGHGRLKTRRTGFKPYKRCSVEANENNVGKSCNQGEEKGHKRIRLEGESLI